MGKLNLVSWDVAKNNVHDASGIDNPQDYMWISIKGVYHKFVASNHFEEEKEKEAFIEAQQNSPDYKFEHPYFKNN